MKTIKHNGSEVNEDQPLREPRALKKVSPNMPQEISPKIPTGMPIDMPTDMPQKISFKEQQFRVREDVVLDVVTRLLASKGFDLMTMDEVASDVGMAKASLYKHFDSKEALAAAAMARMLDRTMDVTKQVAVSQAKPIERLKAIVKWSIEKHLSGDMPLLPSTRSTIRHALMAYPPYVDRLTQVSEQLGDWITAAQASGDLNSKLPPELVLYTIFARACDPVADFMKLSGAYSDAEIVGLLTATCFEGLG